MREFIIDLTKTLSKGLRAFDDKLNNPQMLDECFNFQTSESGLEEYQPLKSIGWRSAHFNYLPIRDQVGHLWYWYPVFDGHILAGDTVPSEPSTGLDPVAVSGIVEWLEILDEYGAIWKLYPNPGDGFTRATDSTPLTGVGLSNMVWRGTTGESWINRFSVAELSRYAVRVG